VFFPSYGSVAEFLADSAPGGGLQGMLNEAIAANNNLEAAGEGNVAALSAVAYLDSKK